jgi:Zn-dependent peptidase ImmA (M78 family)
MMTPRSWTSGNPNEFAVTLSFAPDPDEGRGASRAMSATWGSFEIWVDGLNLCLHHEGAVTLPAVHWYLLPFLQWFVAHWDELLHEERLPNRNEGRDAWISLRATAQSPPALSMTDAEEWEEWQYQWWSRHALLACRDGGLFPDIVIRRMQDKVEFSWGSSAVAGIPQHCYFFANHGYARVDPQVVAKHLSFVLGSAIEHLRSELPDETAFTSLRADFQNLLDVDRTRQQKALICGLQGSVPIPEALGTLLASRFGQTTAERATRLVVAESPQYCLMFGSVAPDIDEHDVARLIEVVAAIPDSRHDNPLLSSLIRDEPIRSAQERPWQLGYALAEDLHDLLNGKYCQGFMVDVVALFRDLEIDITNVELNDSTIRAIAIAGEYLRPTVAINTRYKYRHSHPYRFTLAHELCHLLHDRTRGVRLAMASGPWAPVDVERRANAFAAMLLMPATLIQAALGPNRIDLDSVHGIWELSNRLGVSFSAAVEHLCNLKFIDDAARDELKQQAIGNTNAKV